MNAANLSKAIPHEKKRIKKRKVQRMPEGQSDLSSLAELPVGVETILQGLLG
ncbi:MAG TPA: hypothetical protein VKT27_08125 [Candidatus Binataceae bacterium]|nr:hypothetical protein [Candidatus Binataceae bacterium]